MELTESNKKSFIRLAWREVTSVLSANITMNPVWDSIEFAVTRVFSIGGFVHIDILPPKASYTKSVHMESLPGKFRIIVSTTDTDLKRRLWEWWESGNDPYRGKIRFGDDEWDARTVASQVEIAMDIFRDVYINGDLTNKSFDQMRTGWDPKP